jgi:hypothetical protein
VTLSTPQDTHTGASPTFTGLTLSSIGAEASDVDKFLVDSSGVIKYRTGSQVLSDIGGQTQGDVLDDLNTLGAAASDGQFIVATGAGVFAYESTTTARTSLGVGTGDSPQLTGIELGHASDTTLTRVSAGVVAIEGSNIATVGGMATKVSVYLSGAQTISNATFTKVQLDTENFDLAGDYDNSSNYRLQPSTAGYYMIAAGAGITPMPTGKIYAVMIYKNGTRVAMSEMHTNSAGDALAISTSRLLYMDGSSDYAELYVYHNSGGDEDIYAGNNWTFLTAFGPV